MFEIYTDGKSLVTMLLKSLNITEEEMFSPAWFSYYKTTPGSITIERLKKSA